MGEHDTRDILFLACMRPAMIFGVPLSAFLVNGFVWVVVFAKSPPLAPLPALLSFLVLRALTRTDHNVFRKITVWVQTKGRSLDKATFGGGSLSPLLLSRPSRKDVIPYV